MKKNLIIVFSTFVVGNDNERLKEYAACYKQLLRVLPSNFETLFVDNSVNSFLEIEDKNLQELLSQQNFICINYNRGLRNKGVGELSMLIEVSKIVDFHQYENICYCTGRKFFTCPYPFEKATSTEKLATVSNPDCLFLDGTLLVSHPQMYNDMFFSMKPQLMLQFIRETETVLNEMEKRMINSETNLFEFIQRHRVEVQMLDFLGLIRSDKQAMPEKSIYHIC